MISFRLSNVPFVASLDVISFAQLNTKVLNLNRVMLNSFYLHMRYNSTAERSVTDIVVNFVCFVTYFFLKFDILIALKNPKTKIFIFELFTLF